MEGCSSSSKNSGTGKEFNHHFNPVSVFEPSFEIGSCIDNRISTNGTISLPFYFPFFSTYIHKNKCHEIKKNVLSIASKLFRFKEPGT